MEAISKEKVPVLNSKTRRALRRLLGLKQGSLVSKEKMTRTTKIYWLMTIKF